MKEVLITSSVLIIVIMLLRWLLRGKVSQRLIYAAWILVALRLLIPFQFGQIGFSVLTAAEPVTKSITEISDKQVGGVTEQDSYRQVIQEYIEDDRTVFTPAIQDRIQLEIMNETPKEEIAVIIDKVYSKQEVFTPEAQPQVQQKVETKADPITLGQILTAIWIIGMCAMAAWFVTANLIFLRRAKKDSVEAEFDGVRIRISPNVPTPCVVGLFRPVIYLTSASAEKTQVRAHVLAHEQAHLRQADHIWAMVRCICLCVYWFDPLVWVAAAQSRRDCELACDESALKNLGDPQRIAYGRTLLDIVSQSASPVHLLETATAINESKKQLTERVKFIVKKPRNILNAAICMVLVAAITTGCAFLDSFPKESAAPTTPTTQPDTPPGPTQPSNPSLPSNPDYVPVVPDSPALQTAETLVTYYAQYLSVGVCCTFEQVSEDMSAYLSDSQKENYHNWQYRITCCHSAQEIHEHIDRTLAEELQVWDDIDNLLFTDDKGQLYLIVIPMGAVRYRNVSALEANGRMYAKSGAYDEDGWFADVYFIIEERGGNHVITQALRTDVDEIPSAIKNLTFPLHIGTLFDDPSSWYLRALTSSYTTPADANIASFFSKGFHDEAPITNEEWESLKNVPGFKRNENLHRLPKARMNQVLMQVFGLTLDQMSGIGMEKLTYLESTDCYYLMGTTDVLPEIHFTETAHKGSNHYTAFDSNGASAWYVYISETKNGPRIEQNAMTYAQQVLQTTQLAKEHLGMTRLEFLYTSTLILQEKMKAEGWSEADQESVYWNAHSIKNRKLYLEDGVLMMQAQYSSLAAPEDPLHKTIYIPYESPDLPMNFKDDCFYWLIDMANHTDGYVADAHAGLLLECAVVDPDLFLAVLSECDQDTIDICWGQLYYGVNSPEDADALNAMLDHLSARTDLNDRERQTLNKLRELPTWY